MTTTVYTNDFSAVSDGTRLYTMPGWELSASTQGDYNSSAVVQGGHLRANSTNGVLAFRDAGGPDHFSEVVFSFTPTGAVQAGPAVRCDGRRSFIGMRPLSGTQVDIYYKNGSDTAVRIGAAINLSVVTGMRVRLQVDGDTVKLYANGSEVASSSRDITGIGIKCGKAGVFLTGNSTTNLFDEVVFGVLGDNWLMIDNIIPRQVHPAIGTTYTKAITGSYGGATTPTAIEYRVRDFITGNVINDWATLDAAPSGGAFAGSVTLPKANWYNIETRFANATTVNNWSSRLGIGLLFEFGGQSNVVNLFSYRNTALIPAEQTSTYEHSSGKWRVPEFSSITVFLNALATAAGCVVSAYTTAVTGSQIAFHLPGGGNYATRTAALTAVGGKMSGFYWGQGETDAENGSLTYEADIASLYTDQQSITGQSSAQLPMFIVQLGRKEGFTVGNSGWSRIRSNQKNFVAATANTYISHQTMDLPMADSLHRNESGYAQECLRAVDTMSNVLLGTANNGRGPIPTGITKSGSDLVIAHNLNGSASLSLPANAKDGYQVSNDDFATTLTISSIGTSGANITLTMASAPTGTVKVRSQWGQDPDDTKMPTGSKTYNGQAVMAEPLVNPMLASEPSSGTLTKIWSGSAWVQKLIKIWDGTAWVQKPIKYWNGTEWI